MRYDPSSPAVALPATVAPEVACTVAPDTPLEVVLSVTRPAMEPVCAPMAAGTRTAASRHRDRLIERGVILTSCRLEWRPVYQRTGRRVHGVAGEQTIEPLPWRLP